GCFNNNPCEMTIAPPHKTYLALDQTDDAQKSGRAGATAPPRAISPTENCGANDPADPQKREANTSLWSGDESRRYAGIAALRSGRVCRSGHIVVGLAGIYRGVGVSSRCDRRCE